MLGGELIRAKQVDSAISWVRPQSCIVQTRAVLSVNIESVRYDAGGWRYRRERVLKFKDEVGTILDEYAGCHEPAGDG